VRRLDQSGPGDGMCEPGSTGGRQEREWWFRGGSAMEAEDPEGLWRPCQGPGVSEVIGPARTPSEDKIKCPVIVGSMVKGAGPHIFLLMI
jgi:hypothetical protein